jgi:Do/DeqQ family serine protease
MKKQTCCGFPVWCIALCLLALLATGSLASAQQAAPVPTQPTLAPLVEKVAPAVVNISVLSRSPLQDNPLLRDPFFRRFFDLPDPDKIPPQMSAGSGVIVDAGRGYVITNHHVVEKAAEIVVTLRDRRQFKAKLLGSDAATDIAVVQIEPDRLTQLSFADSDKVRVGDYVLAIGNPFGLGQTVTMGIVSALGRSGINAEGYEDFIQTDAAINPGNSGGALVSLNGELVGINTAIIAPSGGNVGIGFAVSSNMARSVMEQLIRYGEVQRGRLGFLVQDLTPDIAKAIGLSPATEGAVVMQVEPGSAADRAGIKAGDVVTALGGRPVRGASDLRNRIGLTRAGEDVELTILRNGAERRLRARVERSSGAPQAATLKPDAGTVMPRLQGAVVRDIAPGMPMYGKVQGVVVVEVQPGSPAAARGLRAGDVIVAVNRKPVRNVAEFQAALLAARPVAALDVLRGDTTLFIIVS